MNLQNLYKNRFNSHELQSKYKIWTVLCDDFFQQYIPANSTVVDMGAGSCEFINNIKCSKKIALDSNPETLSHAGPDVTFIHTKSPIDIQIPENSVDIVFMSNFLEHMQTKNHVLDALGVAHNILKPNGAILILQPNIRFLANNYWDFFDHHIPLSDRSLCEAMELVGFKTEECIPRFIPYTTKGNIPKDPIFVKIYLKLRPLWWILGKQCFCVGRKQIQQSY